MSKGFNKSRGGRPSGRTAQGGSKGKPSGKSTSSARGGSGRSTGAPSSARPHTRTSARSNNESRPHPSQRPVRDKARWVVGLHACGETLKVRPHSVRELWIRDDYKSSQSLRDLVELAEACSIELKAKAASQLDAVGSGHQGVALAALEAPSVDWDLLKAEGKAIVVVLDGIEDPHNLGSMLRTSWLTEVSAILIPEDRAVALTPAVCKVASGGAEHVPVEAHSNLATAIADLKEAGFWVYGLAEGGKNRPWDLKLPEKVAWVVGNESSGLRITSERACDELVRIPQAQTGSSYNASIALSMVLAETCRQFGKPE